jgi:hypothetical protein
VLVLALALALALVLALALALAWWSGQQVYREELLPFQLSLSQSACLSSFLEHLEPCPQEAQF